MIKKIIIIFCGIVFMAIGTALCHYTQFGIDPFNAFCVGVSNMLHISLGLLTLIIQFIIASFIFIIQKKNLGIGSIIPMVFFGYLLQIMTEVMKSVLPTSQSVIICVILFGVGMISIAFGMSLYMNCHLGMVPYDAITFSIGEKIHKNPFYLRVVLDILVAFIALLIGGPIQIGTILLAFGIGPILNILKAHTIKLIEKGRV